MPWNSRGLRGSTFEEMINMTNEVYQDKKLAIIQKIPTPITPVAIDKSRNAITLGYFEKKSTVDYLGVVQGIPICFDAKETHRKNLPLQNIHAHQIEFMDRFGQQKGVGFFLVNFSMYNEIFFAPFDFIKEFWVAAENGGRKSIPYTAFNRDYIVTGYKGALVHYLETLRKFLNTNEA